MYGEALDNHPDDPPSIKLGEIIPVNPNSYKSIKIVFKNLQDQSEVGKKRKWVRIGFDGVPYRMASQIIKNTIECLSCKNEFKNKIIYQSNLPECAGSADQNNFRKSFENILLVTGAGHMEKNI